MTIDKNAFRSFFLFFSFHQQALKFKIMRSSRWWSFIYFRIQINGKRRNRRQSSCQACKYSDSEVMQMCIFRKWSISIRLRGHATVFLVVLSIKLVLRLIRDSLTQYVARSVHVNAMHFYFQPVPSTGFLSLARKPPEVWPHLVRLPQHTNKSCYSQYSNSTSWIIHYTSPDLFIYSIYFLVNLIFLFIR